MCFLGSYLKYFFILSTIFYVNIFPKFSLYIYLISLPHIYMYLPSLLVC